MYHTVAQLNILPAIAVFRGQWQKWTLSLLRAHSDSLSPSHECGLLEACADARLWRRALYRNSCLKARFDLLSWKKVLLSTHPDPLRSSLVYFLSLDLGTGPWRQLLRHQSFLCLPEGWPNYWTEHSTATCDSHCTPDLDGPGGPCRAEQFSTGCLDNCTAGRRSEFILFYYGGDLLLINKLNIFTCHPNSQQTFSSYSGTVTHLKSKIQDIW